ncbi:MAG: hypothetical protein GY787_25300 [Alteromonadales bacterium]|nr:hypothetical protein [Alteromonadales bacterium]
MKKILIIAILLISAGATAFYFLQQSKQSTYNVLDYVPADSPIFSAQLQPFPIKDYLKSSAGLQLLKQTQFAYNIDGSEPQDLFFQYLLQTYQVSILDADIMTTTFGLADDIRGYFYTLGLLPVLKIEVAKPEAIWKLLDSAEKQSGFSHRLGKIGEQEYRAYRLNDLDQEYDIEMVFAQNNGLLTITLTSSRNFNALLINALGLKKVDNPLSQSGIIEKIRTKYGFSEQNISYLNHQEIVKGLTTTDQNQLAQQLSLFLEVVDKPSLLNDIRTPECAADFAAIAENWPRSVFGYKSMNITNSQSTLEMSGIIESNNSVFIEALKSIRGDIAQYTQEHQNNVFSLALALDMNKINSAMSNILNDLKKPNYQCQPLQEMQASIQQQGHSSLAMLSMATGMANGVQGIAFALVDYAISTANKKPTLDNLDLVISYSADNPFTLFNAAKALSPELAEVELLDSGEGFDLKKLFPFPLPKDIKLAPKAAIKGQHLVIYNGEKGQELASQLSSQALQKNGLFEVAFDFQKLLTPIIALAELTGEQLPAEVGLLKSLNMDMQFSFDVNEHGLIFDSYDQNRSN